MTKHTSNVFYMFKQLSPLIPTSGFQHRLFCSLQQRHPSLVNALNHLRITTHDSVSVASVHCLALKSGALADLPTSTSLLSLYARAHDLRSARCLFEEIPSRDVVSWNAMITVYVQYQHFGVALELFREMKGKGEDGIFGFDSTTLVIVVSAVSRMNDLRQGWMIHTLSLKHGMVDYDCYLCNAIVDMYAKCGDLSSAECVFESMVFRDVASWNSIMSGCLCNGLGGKTLWYFKKMCLSGGDDGAIVLADNLSLSCAISACSDLGELQLHNGQALHGFAIKLGYEATSNNSVGNALIAFYSQCGDIEASEMVFRGMTHKNDVVSWNSMIHGFVKNVMFSEAFSLLYEMQSTWPLKPDLATLLSILPLCAESKLLHEGRSVHGFIVRREMGSDLSLANSLMDMYSKCNFIEPAELLFMTMGKERDLISWNTMIAGYSQNEFSREAQDLFKELLYSGNTCSVMTLLAVLHSCNSSEHLPFGKTVHGWQLKMGFLDNVLVNNSLMSMYINSGYLEDAFSLLHSATTADVVSWNTVIVGCAHSDHLWGALEAFDQMRYTTPINPDSITLLNILSICGNLKLGAMGRCLHGLTHKTPMGSDVRVMNALITMYSRCEDIESARSVFITSPSHNLCSWNCMISGFAQNKEGRRALELYRCIAFEPNEMTIVGILSASTQLGILGHGKQIHGYTIRCGLQQNSFILAALVDMYSKCGRLDTAIHTFRGSPEKSIASWNSLISAYGLHGYGRKAIQLFREMSESGITATKSTFVSLLSACSHAGLVEEGQMYYNLMLQEFGVEPTTEHHVCIVDMLGRHGRLDKAYEFIKSIPNEPATGVWGALLSACKYHLDLKMGKQVAEHLFDIEPQNVGSYVTLFNMYAAAGRWSDAVSIRKVIEDRMLTKEPGYSLIEVCSR